MTHILRVILEIGMQRRVVAGAMDWPGLDRWRTSEDAAIEKLLAYLDAMRAYDTDGRPARTWPLQFLIRRTAHHVMDHAWELEDRGL